MNDQGPVLRGPRRGRGPAMFVELAVKETTPNIKGCRGAETPRSRRCSKPARDQGSALHRVGQPGQEIDTAPGSSSSGPEAAAHPNPGSATPRRPPAGRALTPGSAPRRRLRPARKPRRRSGAHRARPSLTSKPRFANPWLSRGFESRLWLRAGRRRLGLSPSRLWLWAGLRRLWGSARRGGGGSVGRAWELDVGWAQAFWKRASTAAASAARFWGAQRLREPHQRQPFSGWRRRSPGYTVSAFARAARAQQGRAQSVPAPASTGRRLVVVGGCPPRPPRA